jgi:[histone H3]-lysine4/36 N-trimethyltransferase SMYD
MCCRITWVSGSLGNLVLLQDFGPGLVLSHVPQPCGPGHHVAWMAMASMDVVHDTAEDCQDCIEVREVTGRGRGIFALKALPAGVLVMRALPGAVALNTSALQTHCSVCMQPLEPHTPTCSECGVACLCRRCSRAEGPRRIHGDECAMLKLLERTPKSERPSDTTTLRLLARLLLWRWRARTQPEAEHYMAADGSWWGGGDVLGDDFDDVLELCQPPDELLPEKLAAAFLDIAQQARFFLGSHARAGHEEVMSLLGILHCNSLTIYDDQREASTEIGVAISSSAAMFNASCQPSVGWRLDSDGCFCIRTLRPVLAGDELTFCYVDPRLPASTRRAKLSESYFFSCDCRACVAGVAQWSCVLCGGYNDAFSTRCAAPRCTGEQKRDAMPMGKRKRAAVQQAGK